MEQSVLFFRFGVALGIGILVGLQREFAATETEKEIPAGIRTFGLISLLGACSGLLSDILHSYWPILFTFFILGLFFAVNYYIEASQQGRIGLTTKVASLITLFCGALAYWDYIPLSIAIGVSMTILLSIKIELHQFAHKITRSDIIATLKFAVISAIILPVLPNKVFGPFPFNIFNPQKLWLFVVFISGISFIGFILIKTLGSQRGIGLTGIFGGLASSTAVTISFTDRSKKNPELSSSFALAIMIAWTVMFIRVAAVVAVVNKSLLKFIWFPMLLSVIIGLLWCSLLFIKERRTENGHDVKFSNPFELGPALKFGLIFALILAFSKIAQVYLGDVGVYLSSFISGLADVDAITYSMSKMSVSQPHNVEILASRAIIIAAVANTILKGSVVLISGANQLKKAMAPGFILMTVAALVTIFLTK